MVTEGLLIRLEARSGKDAELEEFLRSANKAIQLETTTSAWFALRFGRSDYGIVNLFPNSAGRDAYLEGQVSRALKERGETLLSRYPTVLGMSVLAEKLPGSSITVPEVSKGLLLTFKAKAGHEMDVERMLLDAQPMVMEEPDTVAWCSVRFDNGVYGIFDVFPDGNARFRHITGHVPRELAKHAFTMFGSFPDMEMVDVLAAKM